MSQASRSKATRLVRERERVAWFIAGLCDCDDGRVTTFYAHGDGHQGHSNPCPKCDEGERFDVHAARKAALELESYDRADFRAAEAIVADWRRERTRLDGKPPMPPSWPADWMNWRERSRLGRAVLRALEGQPSACQGCIGVVVPVVMATADGGMIHARPGQRIQVVTASGITVFGKDGEPREAQLGEAVLGSCPDCRGTGHNLRGVLPPVEWPAVVRRKISDATAQLDHESRWGGACWVDTLARQMPFGWGRLLQAMPGDRGPELHACWRVTPRGEHRHDERDISAGMSVDEKINARGWAVWVDRRSMTVWSGGAGAAPKWWVGELRHAEQRRERERRREIERLAERIGGEPMRLSPAPDFDIARLAAEHLALFIRANKIPADEHGLGLCRVELHRVFGGAIAGLDVRLDGRQVNLVRVLPGEIAAVDLRGTVLFAPE